MRELDGMVNTSLVRPLEVLKLVAMTSSNLIIAHMYKLLSFHGNYSANFGNRLFLSSLPPSSPFLPLPPSPSDVIKCAVQIAKCVNAEFTFHSHSFSSLIQCHDHSSLSEMRTITHPHALVLCHTTSCITIGPEKQCLSLQVTILQHLHLLHPSIWFQHINRANIPITIQRSKSACEIIARRIPSTDHHAQTTIFTLSVHLHIVQKTKYQVSMCTELLGQRPVGHCQPFTHAYRQSYMYCTENQQTPSLWQQEKLCICGKEKCCRSKCSNIHCQWPLTSHAHIALCTTPPI